MKTIHFHHGNNTMKQFFRVTSAWLGTYIANAKMDTHQVLAFINVYDASQIVLTILQYFHSIIGLTAGILTSIYTLSLLMPKFRAKFFPKKDGVVAVFKNLTEEKEEK